MQNVFITGTNLLAFNTTIKRVDLDIAERNLRESGPDWLRTQTPGITLLQGDLNDEIVYGVVNGDVRLRAFLDIFGKGIVSAMVLPAKGGFSFVKYRPLIDSPIIGLPEIKEL